MTCGVCGFVINDAGVCPRCKLIVKETARDIEARQDMREAMFREVETILEEGWEDSSRST